MEKHVLKPDHTPLFAYLYQINVPDGVFGIFHWHNPSGRTMGPAVYSASNRNEYQEYFLGAKVAGA